jgi:hypothetical protein
MSHLDELMRRCREDNHALAYKDLVALRAAIEADIVSRGVPADATQVEWKDSAWKVWRLAREHNNTIPSHWLDVMREIVIAAAPQPQPVAQPSAWDEGWRAAIACFTRYGAGGWSARKHIFTPKLANQQKE